MSWLKERWPAMALGAAFALAASTLVGERCDSAPVASPGLRAQLAEAKIPAIRAESKAKRRAARARVDEEVSRAASASDLVEYTNSRAP